MTGITRPRERHHTAVNCPRVSQLGAASSYASTFASFHEHFAEPLGRIYMGGKKAVPEVRPLAVEIVRTFEVLTPKVVSGSFKFSAFQILFSRGERFVLGWCIVRQLPVASSTWSRILWARDAGFLEVPAPNFAWGGGGFLRRWTPRILRG